MPSVTESVRLTPSPSAPTTVTPAAKKANTGTATAGRQRPEPVLEVLGQPGPGDRRCGGSTGTVNPSSTPATVACTPDACTSTQVAAASGSSSHHDRTRRCTSSANSASGTSASSSGNGCSELGVEHRDDRDREQVVDHGEGEQERAQRRGQMACR